MGTNYLLASSEGVTVSLHEQSCTFDLSISDSFCDIDLCGLTPENIQQMCIQMLEDVSHFTDDPDKFLQETGNKLKQTFYNNLGPIILC